MQNLLLLLVVLGVACLDWWIYGKKGVALINRSPWLLFWASGEVLLGMLSGYVCVDAFVSRDWIRILLVSLANMIGCAGGVAMSGAIKWRSR